MLKKAFKKDGNLNGLIMHLIKGGTIQHTTYQKMLKDNGITQSMSPKGNCLSHAMMENFFGLMKNELLYVNSFASIEEFEREVKKNISHGITIKE